MNQDPWMENDENRTKLTANVRYLTYQVAKRRWLCLSIFFVLMLGLGYYLVKAPRVYRAVTRVEIEPARGEALRLGTDRSVERPDRVFLETQIRRLESSSLQNSVLRSFDREEAPQEASSSPDFSQWLGGGNNPVAQSATWVLEQGYHSLTALDQTLEGLVAGKEPMRPNVQARGIRDTYLVDVVVDHRDPEGAADLANRLVEAFIQTNAVERSTASTNMAAWLEKEARHLEDQVKAAEDRVQAFKEKHKDLTFENGEESLLTRIEESRGQLQEARSSLADARELRRFTERMREDAVDQEAVAAMTAKNYEGPLWDRLIRLKVELSGLMTRYKSKHPLIQQRQREIESLKDVIAQEAAARENEMAARVEELQTRLAELQANRLDYNQLKSEYDTLTRNAEQSRELYHNVMTRLKEEQVVSNMHSKNIKVLERASPPSSPVFPRVWQTVLLGMFLSMGVAMGTALLLNAFDETVCTPADVESALGQRFLGYIPKIRARRGVVPHIFAHQMPQDIASEGFRTIRTALSLRENDKRLRVFTVTSSQMGEGKSLVASNLAIVMAQAGFKTLLVEADFRRPLFHKLFSLPAKDGLASYLTHPSSSPDSVIRETEIKGLSIAHAGLSGENAAELAGSQAMVTFLEEARKRFDRVILDSPPVSVVSDPLVLNGLADGAIFVTRFGKVRKEEARRWLDRIQETGVAICGVVCNGIDSEGRDGSYADYFYDQYRNFKRYHSRQGPAESPALSKPSTKASKAV